VRLGRNVEANGARVVNRDTAVEVTDLGYDVRSYLIPASEPELLISMEVYQ